MKVWWFSREENERRLMTVVGVLLGLVLIVQMLITPLRASRMDALGAHVNSIRSLNVVRAELGHTLQLAGDERASTKLNTDALRSATTGLALERGLSVSRIQTGVDGKVTVSLESADPRLVYAWLKDVRGKFGVDIVRVSISQGSAGQIQTIIDFQGAS